jgi:hypothetical protein
MALLLAEDKKKASLALLEPLVKETDLRFRGGKREDP